MLLNLIFCIDVSFRGFKVMNLPLIRSEYLLLNAILLVAQPNFFDLNLIDKEQQKLHISFWLLRLDFSSL